MDRNQSLSISQKVSGSQRKTVRTGATAYRMSSPSSNWTRAQCLRLCARELRPLDRLDDGENMHVSEPVAPHEWYTYRRTV